MTRTLALEFSTARRSVAVGEWEPGGEVRVLGELCAAQGEHGTAVALVEQVLRLADLPPEVVEQVVVGLGPGSYTGIRSAIAFAQGWALARPVTLPGIDSMHGLAHQAARSGWAGDLLLLADAQRGEFYRALYRLEGGGARNVEAIRLATREEIEADRQVPMAGPDLEKLLPQARPLHPEATALLELARAGHPAWLSPPLEPVYLRPVSFVKAPPPRLIP
jgi:tRNA threonylcarbamoyladenosine biosynthesis protein TsaB